MLNYWSQVQQIYSVEKYSNPVIWNNQDVLIGNEPVFYKSLLEAEILTTDDIKGLSIAQAVTHSKNNGEKNFNFLTLLALRTATKDVQGVLCNKLYFYDQENLFITNNEGEFKDVRNMKCKHFYDIFLSNLKEKPSKSLKLKSDYSLTDEDLQSIYLLPQKLTTETYVRSFQYKVLNGILYSRKFLLKFGLVEDDKCLECKQLETMEHMLFECNVVRDYWKKLETFWYSQSKFKISLKKRMLSWVCLTKIMTF